jgi:hypothetical protein
MPAVAVEVAVDKVVWAARAVVSATDRVASKVELAVLAKVSCDAAVAAEAAVAVTADAFVDAAVLTFEVVYSVSPPLGAVACAWALSAKAVVAAAATPVKRTIFLFNILQFLNYAI